MSTVLSPEPRHAPRLRTSGRLRASEDNSHLLERLAALEARLAVLEEAKPPQEIKAETDIPWVVIAAAVSTVIRKPFAVRSVRALPVREASLWSLEGRLRHFASRSLR